MPKNYVKFNLSYFILIKINIKHLNKRKPFPPSIFVRPTVYLYAKHYYYDYY